MQLKATVVFEKNYDEYQKGTRIVVNQGGTRSSKTYSIAQLFLVLLLTKRNTIFTVTRKTLPALRATAMRDFFGIMKEEGIYREELHNKTEFTYRVGSNEIEFISVDEPQKVRGRKRGYLWMNETNEFSYEDFRQLNLRTEKQIFMDFNPSDEFHWIYDHILTRDDSTLIKSTYKDNPFLDQVIVKEIENLRDLDPNYWRIYGLGERGISEAKIYSHWQYCDDLPEGGETIYGLDFGFNHPTALVKIKIVDDRYYWKELLYRSYLTNPEVITLLKDLVPQNEYLYADSENPQDIEEIRRAGFNIKPMKKEAGSVLGGIRHIKSHEWFITKDSVNGLKEVKSYSWKQKDGKNLDEPLKVNDDFLDAGRGAIYTHTSKPKTQLFMG